MLCDPSLDITLISQHFLGDFKPIAILESLYLIAGGELFPVKLFNPSFNLFILVSSDANMVANVGYFFSIILQLLSAICIRFYVVKNSFHINCFWMFIIGLQSSFSKT